MEPYINWLEYSSALLASCIHNLNTHTLSITMAYIKGLKALIAAATATAIGLSQARIVAPAQIPGAYSAHAAVAPGSQLTYSIHLHAAPGQKDALTAKMLDIAHSGGEWLSVAELKRYTRASDTHIEQVKSHLSKHGGKNIQLSQWGDKITVTHSAQ